MLITLNKSKEKKIIYFLFLIYMCTVMAHKRGYGFDALICRLSFIALVVVFSFFVLKGHLQLRIQKKGFCVGMFAFSFFYYISFLWAKNVDSYISLGIINSMTQILLSAIIVESTIDNLDDCKVYLKIYLYAVLYMMIWVIVATPFTVWGTERVGEAIGLNSNSIGIRCANAFLFSLFFTTEKGEKKKTYVIIMAIASFISLFSGSRKAFLVLMLGFVIYWCAQKKGLKMLIRLLIAAVIVACVIYLIMQNEALYQVLGKRIERGFKFFMGINGSVTDLSSVERKFYREYAMSMFLERPLLGYGGNAFVAEMSRINYSHIAYSHCNYTEILSSLGIIGFFLYYFLQGKMIISTIKQRLDYNDKNRKLTCLLLALIITNLVKEYYMVTYYSVEIQVLIAMIFSTQQCIQKERRKSDI